MAQLNITLNQEEILQLLCNDRDAAFKTLLENSLNSVLKAESAKQLKAEPYERSETRTDSRNGFRDRPLNTRIGTITLSVPRHRNVPFKTMIFDEYCRSEAALIACMAEMVVNGTSTRKISRVMETLCGTSFSKSAVSDVCKDLDEAVTTFRTRPLTDHYPFVTVDATYFKVRSDHRITSKAFMIAYGVNSQGTREILGFAVYDSETKDSWHDFFIDLRQRGLSGVLMITSDAHEGIKNAVGRVFPEVPWQRCQFHFLRNITDKAPKKYQPALRAALQEMFRSESLRTARKKRDAIIEEYRDVAATAMECLEEGFEDSMTVMMLPKHLRKYFRTSNHIERLNKELKRRSNVIGVFTNTESVTRLMGAVLMERNDCIQAMKRVFSTETYTSLLRSDVPAKLISIAKEQLLQVA